MDKRPSYLFSEVGAFGRFSGTFTMASAMCMFSCGVLLLLIARSRAPFSRSERLAWVVAAVGLMTLAFDELMQLHEWIGGGLSWLGVPFPFGLAADNYVFLGYASAALWVMLRLLPKFATVSQALPWAVIMLVCYAFSQMVDLVPLERLAERTILILAPIEEAPKVIGSFAALLFGIFAHEQITQGPRA